MEDDGVPTLTSIEQQKLEEVVSSIYSELASSDGGLDSIQLWREKHAAFLRRGLEHLPSGYASLDASRPWLCYWILHSLALLGQQLERQVALRCIDTLQRCQDPDGGFAGGPGQMPHLATTYAAVCSLVTVGGGRALQVINRPAMLRFLLRMKCPDGSFRMQDDGETDVRGCYTALAVARLLDITTPQLTSKVGDYIASCQTYEGGIGGLPGVEAHGGYTFCGLAALVLAGQEDALDLPLLLDWAVARQGTVEGGFQGRTNKLVDGCYSFWQGGAFPLLHRLLPKLSAQFRHQQTSGSQPPGTSGSSRDSPEANQSRPPRKSSVHSGTLGTPKQPRGSTGASYSRPPGGKQTDDARVPETGASSGEGRTANGYGGLRQGHRQGEEVPRVSGEERGASSWEGGGPMQTDRVEGDWEEIMGREARQTESKAAEGAWTGTGVEDEVEDPLWGTDSGRLGRVPGAMEGQSDAFNSKGVSGQACPPLAGSEELGVESRRAGAASGIEDMPETDTIGSEIDTDDEDLWGEEEGEEEEIAMASAAALFPSNGGGLCVHADSRHVVIEEILEADEGGELLPEGQAGTGARWGTGSGDGEGELDTMEEGLPGQGGGQRREQVPGSSSSRGQSFGEVSGRVWNSFGPLFNAHALQGYILVCCQVPEGGLIDKPGKMRDYYHTCYCLSGLSSAQHCLSGSDPPSPGEVLGPFSNLLEPIEPLCNVRMDRYMEARDYFSSCPRIG